MEKPAPVTVQGAAPPSSGASGTQADPPAPAATADSATPAAAPAARSGVALILPSKSTAFARAAEMVRAGFNAARNVARSQQKVSEFESDGTPDGARDALARALAANVAVVVGPLTRDEVGGIFRATSPVPVLALNTPEGDARAPDNVLALSLAIEAEARSVAHAAYRPEAPTAVVVSMAGALPRRAALAFGQAWTRLGGNLREGVEFAGSVSRVRQAVERARADVVFLATDAERARLIRPYLGRNANVIGTSQIFAGPPREGQKALDLNGVRFVDMPWLHQADHAATMVYPRPEAALSVDLERLYALGIDAWRVADELVRARTDFEIDGVTGALTVRGGAIERTPLLLEYRDGEAVTAAVEAR